jgi:tetratricopeptide (TPR) repeat protein
MNELDAWGSDTSSKIENDLLKKKQVISGQFKLPLPYSINIDNDIQGFNKNVIKAKLRSLLNNSNYSLTHSRKEDNSLLNILITKNNLIVQVGILNGVYIHNLDKRENENFTEDLSKDILLSAGMCMLMVNQSEYGGRILFDNNLDDRLLEKPELLLGMLPGLADSSYFKRIMSIVEQALGKYDDDFDIALMSTTYHLLLRLDKTPQNNTIVESFYLSQIQKCGSDKKSIGTKASYYYNLGNYYRNSSDFLKAIHYYNQAKRNDNKYLSRFYFIREFAGICFLSNKFVFASMFYKKALNLKSDIETKSLFADSLMFAGKYEDAIKNFSIYIDESESPTEEFALKLMLLEGAVEDNKIKSQKRHIGKAFEAAGRKLNEDEAAEIFKNDMLCSLAWFNLGLTYKESNDFDSSMFCFAFAASINLNDSQAWLFAFLSFMNSNNNANVYIGALILKTAYRHNGDAFLGELYYILEENNTSGKDITGLFDDMLAKEIEDESKEKITIRILDDDKYEELKFNK